MSVKRLSRSSAVSSAELSTSLQTCKSVASGICLDGQAALPSKLKVEHIQTGPVGVVFRR